MLYEVSRCAGRSVPCLLHVHASASRTLSCADKSIVSHAGGEKLTLVNSLVRRSGERGRMFDSHSFASASQCFRERIRKEQRAATPRSLPPMVSPLRTRPSTSFDYFLQNTLSPASTLSSPRTPTLSPRAPMSAREPTYTHSPREPISSPRVIMHGTPLVAQGSHGYHAPPGLFLATAARSTASAYGGTINALPLVPWELSAMNRRPHHLWAR